jgi:hypothetical protein
MKPNILSPGRLVVLSALASMALSQAALPAHPYKIIKTIEVQGRPDGIVFEPMTERIFAFSHSQPNATVIESKDGSVVGTIDLAGKGVGPAGLNLDVKNHILFAMCRSPQTCVVLSAEDGKILAPRRLFEARTVVG